MKPNFKIANSDLYLYTKGKQFILGLEEYIGEYHKRGSEVYSGPIPDSKSKKLGEYSPDIAVRLYDTIRPDEIKIRKFIDPVDGKIYPTDSQYELGIFTRYFVKKRNEKNNVIFELSSDDVKTYGKPGGIDDGLYQLTELNWFISKKELYIDTVSMKNRNAVGVKNKEMPGLKDHILNYFEFSFIMI